MLTLFEKCVIICNNCAAVCFADADSDSHWFYCNQRLLVKVSAMIKVLKDWYRILLSDPNSATLFILLTCISLIIYFFTDVLTPILLALGVSYILEWPISVLEKRKLLSRTVSTSLLMFIFFSGLILGSIMLLPSLLEQITNLFRKIPDMVGNLEAYFMQKTKEYPAIVEYIDFTVVADALKMKIAEYSSSLIQDKLPSYLMNITTFITYLIIVPLLSFFMLKDKNELLNSLKGVFPPNLSLATKVWVRMNQELMNYISGKFLHVCIIAVVNFLAFRFFDLNYSTLLGISVGLSVVIPYVGAAIVTIPVAGVALYQFGFNSTFGYLMAAYIVIQILDGNVLVPKLFSEKMKLHPFIILASVLVFGSLWGFWGVFFAIPLATLIKTIFTLWPRGEYIEDKHLSGEQHDKEVQPVSEDMSK